MKAVTITTPQSDTLYSQLTTLCNVLSQLKGEESVVFDFSHIDWVYPLLVLPLTAYIKKTSSTITETNAFLEAYLQTIMFPEGVDSISSFCKKMQQAKSYVPISVLKKDAGVDRERLEGLFTEMIYKIVAPTSGAQDALYLPIVELVNNVFEHSLQNEGLVFGQHYKKKNYLDMCIVDCGRGLAKAYKDELGEDFSDIEALRHAMSGISTKPEIDRGWGVRSSKRIVCEGLKGNFLLLSGSAFLLCSEHGERMASLPTNGYWQGVIACYRIPPPKEKVDITPYLETRK